MLTKSIVALAFCLVTFASSPAATAMPAESAASVATAMEIVRIRVGEWENGAFFVEFDVDVKNPNASNESWEYLTVYWGNDLPDPVRFQLVRNSNGELIMDRIVPPGEHGSMDIPGNASTRRSMSVGAQVPWFGF